jgi:oligoribonuclease
MKYLSIDIETTGLNPETSQILQIGLILEDTNNLLPFADIPKLNLIIRQPKSKVIHGSLKALTMNSELLARICKYEESDYAIRATMERNLNASFIYEEFAAQYITDWLRTNDFLHGSNDKITVNVAGKNFGVFDKLFLEQLPGWNEQIQTRNRILDPAILYVDWKNDDTLPSLTQCKERAGIEGAVTHDAIDDAWDVILSLRKFYK